MLEAAERCLAEADRDATWKQLLRSHGAALPIFASGLPPELVSDSGLYDAGSSGGNDGASSRATARYMTPQALGKLRSSVPYPPAESLSRVILRSTPSSKFNWIISEVRVTLWLALEAIDSSSLHIVWSVLNTGPCIFVPGQIHRLQPRCQLRSLVQVRRNSC